MLGSAAGSPKPLTKRGFLKSEPAMSALEYWRSGRNTGPVLRHLLVNWLSDSPMSAARFDTVNLRFSRELGLLSQVKRQDGSIYQVTPYGLAVMVILGVRGAATFLSHCSKAYSVLRNIYLRDPDVASVEVSEFKALIGLNDTLFSKIILLLGELSVGNLSTNVVGRRVYASPTIRNYADIWAVLASILPAFAPATPSPQLLHGLDFVTSRHVSKIAFEELLHPLIREKSLSLYSDGHYRDTALNSVIALFDYIRARTGLTQDGAALASEAFSLDRPRLILSELKTESGRNDQKGFMQIIQGMYLGIRNPKAHSLDHEVDEKMAAQCMVIASFIARRIEEAEVVIPLNS